jgi:NAD(P)-dependent dehydrogenase (short-subunit alcohol dehydrogenase family)
MSATLEDVPPVLAGMSTARRTLTTLGATAAFAAFALSLRRRFPVAGKVVLVTGGSRGLGLAIAETFGRAGARLVLTARDADELARARQLLVQRGAAASPEEVITLPCDLRDQNAVEQMITTAASVAGPIDVLINNAGIIVVGPVENQPLSAFRDAMETNYFGAVYTTLALLPSMLARTPGRDGARGHIVNISSIGGKMAVPHLLPYSASKFAITGFSQGLYAELKPKGIHVTTVCPGLMQTGSPGKALVVGNRAEEFRWFHLGASLPGAAASAAHAARRILAATERGTAEISITPQAAIAGRVAQSLPEVMLPILAFANEYLLPAPVPGGPQQPQPGEQHQGKAVRPLTKAGDHAASLWNQ